MSLDGGRFPPQMLPLLEYQPSIFLISGGDQRLEVLGPEPGTWYMAAGYHGHHGHRPSHCAPVLSVMAEYLIETDIITIIPTFYNFQDIRTFYTVNATQTFKVAQNFVIEDSLKSLSQYEI